jgi:hypothetical protein
MFVLGLITEYCVAHSWSSTEPTSFANGWLKHIRNGEFLQENGPLRFCLALLIFSVVIAAVTKISGGGGDSDETPIPTSTARCTYTCAEHQDILREIAQIHV